MKPKENINPVGVSKIKSLRKKSSLSPDLTQELFNGNKTALGKAITLLESTREIDQKKAEVLIEACLTQHKNTMRIAITGPPGVGKSTFIEAFGTLLTSSGKKVAVLAIDPSSSISKGSILGDKTRMEALAKDPNAFVRPTPSGNATGGVAQKTRETIILCEAAGYDVILIETVGVGQNEITAYSMVDFFLVLQMPGSGDELQGIKRGMMEMADAIAINKADGALRTKATLAQTEFTQALHLFPPKESGWTPRTVVCSALENKGLKEIWALIMEYIALTKKNGHFETHRQQQNKFWLLQTIDAQLKNQFYDNKKISSILDKLMKEVMDGRISPFKAAKMVLRSASQ